MCAGMFLYLFIYLLFFLQQNFLFESPDLLYNVKKKQYT